MAEEIIACACGCGRQKPRTYDPKTGALQIYVQGHGARTRLLSMSDAEREAVLREIAASWTNRTPSVDDYQVKALLGSAIRVASVSPTFRRVVGETYDWIT